MDKCIHGIDKRWCTHCAKTVRPGVAVPIQSKTPTTRAGQRRAPAPPLAYEFVGPERVLALRPDIERRWRFHQKTMCSCEQAIIDSMADRRIRAQVAVFPRPGILQSAGCWVPRLCDSADIAPSRDGLETTLATPNPIRYQVRDGRLAVFVDLVGDDGGFNPLLPWRLKGGKPTIHQIADGLGSAQWTRLGEPGSTDGNPRPSSWCAIHLWLVAEPRPLVLPLSRDWCRRFFPGGLPSLGKRR
jgi:hypothetical protein